MFTVGTLKVQSAIAAGRSVRSIAEEAGAHETTIRAIAAGSIPKVTVALSLMETLGIALVDWTTPAGPGTPPAVSV